MEALREALADGTIDIVATDHAPHPVEDKESEWSAAAMGMIGRLGRLHSLVSASIEAVLDEVLRQRIEQGRVDRRVCVADVVHRLDDPAVEEVAPEAIHEAAGEEAIVGRRQPLGIGFAAVHAVGQLRLGPAEEPRRLRPAGPWIER